MTALLSGTQKRAKDRIARTVQVQDFLKKIGDNNGDVEAVRLVLREKCREDFWFFQCRVYGNEDTVNPLHLEMANRWQARINARFSIWLLPRGHLKTSEFTEAGTLWELISDPNLRFLISNAKLDNAIDIIANIKSCVQSNDIFRWLFPEYCPDLASKKLRQQCKWLTERLDFPCSTRAGRKEGNIEVMSVGANLVSKHYDRMIFDDPVNDDNSSTKEYRDKIYRWYRNALQLRHDANSIIRIIGTRWHFDDLYSRLIKVEYARRKRQKEAGGKVVPRYFIYLRQIVEKVDIGGQTIAGYDDVAPIWPERFTPEAIEEIREENGSYIFSCQHMNNPLPEEDAVFRYSDISFCDEYDIPENIVNFIACDLAVEETEQGDWWVLSVASFDSLGRMYLREVVRDKLTTSTFLAHLNGLCKKWNPVRVGVETTAFQKTLYKIYKHMSAESGYDIPWKELNRGKSSKRKRILAFQPRVERGDFLIEEGIRNSEHVIDEMTTYPKSVNDDILDTLADLEVMFFSAPDEMEVVKPRDTFEALYGSLDAEEDQDELFACSIIR
jgi:hypothetical protein